jgi:heme-degrading monooxygenase HmoA
MEPVPATPWTARTTPDSDATYVVMGTYLPLRGYRYIPRFLADSMKVRRQLAGTDGLIGYALDAKIGRKEFLTVSVWENREALDRFSKEEPHAAITRDKPKRMGPSKFRTWEATGAEVPVGWDAVRLHLAS